MNNIITELFRAIDTQDWEALTCIFHPEVVYERPGYEPFIGIRRLLHFYRKERILATGQHYLECVIVKANYGACSGRFRGITKDNIPADERFADIYSFETGMIKTRRSYFFRPAI